MLKLRKYLDVNDILLLGGLFIAAGLVWNTITAMQRNYRLQQKYDQLQAEVELLELTNQNLRYNIAYLKTDEYLELAARQKFNKSATGETLVYLPNSGQAEKAAVAENPIKTKKAQSTGWRANLLAWWKFLQADNIPDRS